MTQRVNHSQVYIIIFPLILSIFGLSTVFSLGDGNAIFYKQLILHVVGMSFFLTIYFLDFRLLKSGHYVFSYYIFIISLLMALVFLGRTVNGAQSWFNIFGISFQPIEFAKLALMLVLAKYFAKRHSEISYLPTLLISFTYALPIFVLALLQPDLGSGLVVLSIWFLVVLVSGIPKKYLLAIVVLGVFVCTLAWVFFLQTYQKERIFNFLDPARDLRGSGYNVYQSMIAVGSGGVFGKGVNQGSQSKLSFLPEYETDFIFAAFAEEWGLVGGVICILTFLLLIISIFNTVKNSESNFESLLAVGFVGYLLTHTTVNVGMNIGILPVTGIPLPFMSAGGTHILMEWITLALVVSLSKGNKTSKYYNSKEISLH